jgi:beta-glucuronidase
MERLFQTSVLRKRISLNGQWQKCYDPEGCGGQQGYQAGYFPGDSTAYVPSCWNFDLGRYDYSGPVWYARKFITAQSSNSRIIFHAVSGQAEVYLDGEYLGNHYGGYTKFWFDVPDLPAGEHILVVMVDNHLDDESTMPLRFVDWFVWGGIYRDVEVEQFGDLSIERIKIDTNWHGYEVDTIAVRAFVKNWSNSDITEVFQLDIDNKPADSKSAQIGAFETSEICLILKNFKPDLWSPQNPSLYMFHLYCGSDDIFERGGFRKIETRGTQILLNGKEIFIKGVNRHNDDPELGHAVGGAGIYKDMQIIKDLGANAVRGSHYPNDPLVLDYCDQYGLFFWEELPFWNHPATSLANPLLEKRARFMLNEMIMRDYNHPSIIIWGIQNESKSSSKEGLKLFSQLASDMRGMDDSRLVSFASACGREDVCFDLVDVVCWNMYPGWYDDMNLDDLDIKVEESLRNIRQWLEDNGQNKPFLVTEFGAGAMLGECTFDTYRRWSENYQEKLLDQVIKAILNCGVIQGFYIWQFCDTRTALPSRTSIGRPRTFNNKGLVDEHRKPKYAYYTVKKWMHRIPTYPGC